MPGARSSKSRSEAAKIADPMLNGETVGLNTAVMNAGHGLIGAGPIDAGPYPTNRAGLFDTHRVPSPLLQQRVGHPTGLARMR